MKNIHYAGDELMTGDAIADALLDYAATLARQETSATIDVPVITDDGSLTAARFLLGPASQLVAVSVDSAFADPIDEQLLAVIALRVAQLKGMPAVSDEQLDGSDVHDDSQLDYDLRDELGNS